ncbi:MAG: acyl-CoA dehydrogenase family protein [Litorimonas sp.]
MNLEFSEEQTLLGNLVERFTTDHYDLLKRSKYVKLPEGFCPNNWAVMAETGILTVPFSEQYNGLGGKAEDIICVMKPLGKAVAVDPMLVSPILAGSLLEKVGTDAQKDEWIPKIISGQAHISLAHSEPAARYNLDYVKTKFEHVNGTIKLTGKKTFVLGAASANAYIVTAVPQASSSTSNDIAFFLVDKESSGLSSNQYRLIDGSIACELTLDNTPATPMVGHFDDLMSVINLAKIAACAEMVGLMELLLEDTLTHVKTREQFGRPLSKMQIIQHRLADSHVSLELCRSHLLRMAASNETDADYTKMTAGSKAYISKAAVALAEESVQLHGGMGTTNELIIGHAMKRILLLSTLFGDADAEIARFSQSTQNAA